MKKFSAFIVLVAIAFSCTKKETYYNPQLKIDDLKKEIINDHNNESYGIFLDLSANDSLNYESLAFSLLLANEDNPRANHFVFYEMVSLFNKKEYNIDNLEKLSKVNRDFALYYLKRAAKMNEFVSQSDLEEIYRRGIGVEKNEKKADSLLFILKKRQKSYVPDYELK